MFPVVTIVGRPNVGKSTLFNALTRTRDALVADMPGVTRDRIYGEVEFDENRFIVIDTGGISRLKLGVEKHMLNQVEQAIEEADLILFMVDSRQGVEEEDKEIAEQLRKKGKNILLVANKIDGLDSNVAIAEFHSLGIGEPFGIAATQRRGVRKLLEKMYEDLPAIKAIEAEEVDEGIKLAIVGRPNVGKSTLINRLLGEDRVVAFDKPGTTRDSIFIPMERRGEKYTLIDTAGVRRRGKVGWGLEKFSVIKALQAVEVANVVVLVLDATEGITNQDLHLLGFILQAGKGLIITVNKWDGLTAEKRERVNKELKRRLDFIDFARVHAISALHGTGVGDLFRFVKEAYRSATKKISTPEANRLLEAALEQHAPPLVNGRRIKLRYAHAGGQNPPLIVIHGNQTERVPVSYQRYLINFFRNSLKLMGTPLRVEFKTSENPFAGRKNVLTPSQERKRARLMKRVKKKKK